MDMRQAIARVVEGRSLAEPEMEQVMRLIMTGGATPAQIAGFLVALRLKGETVEELAAAARVMRELASRVEVPPERLVDTCGTGGDASGTFNISTAAALVAAAAGARVAKHGNRAVSGRSGSADLLEAAGVRLDLPPEAVGRCIREVGVGFLFAPAHHGAMRHAIGPRRELGVRTLFNLLGPLTNPAGAPHQVLGVFDARWVEPLAEVARRLGARRVLVVHGLDGLDEISLGAPTEVAEVAEGELRRYRIRPEALGLEPAPLEALRAGSVAESLARVEEALADRPGPARDVVALNAGAALYAAGVAEDLREGLERAREAIASGAARAKLEELAAYSRRAGGQA
ncbi:MAG: anthranilate phosphoribosyltransferase [Gammaproteobacteria bacterium]|nr:MAG: anthranilate phosphoribosyltransferase [Gammaproteobacteria bacterium]